MKLINILGRTQINMMTDSPFNLLHPVLSGAILFGMVVTLSGCGSSNQTESQTAVNTSPDAHAQAVDSSTTQANTPFTQTSQPNSDLLQGVTSTVYKDINCGCCTGWIEHAQHAGMHTSAQHPQDLAVFKDRYGVPPQMRACHTAVTDDGYVFEGHIPAKFIAQFLDNPPTDAIGLAVPGMPVGSPGMEYEDKFMPYNVFKINKDGTYDVFMSVDTPEQQL